MRHRLNARLTIVNIAVMRNKRVLTGSDNAGRIMREFWLYRGNTDHDDMRLQAMPVKLLWPNRYSKQVLVICWT